MHFVQHPSVRVPRHDGGWQGRLCADPATHHACTLPDTIGKKREDLPEAARSGQDGDNLNDQRPPCERERGASLSERDHLATRKHPCAWSLNSFEPARLALPAHSGSAGCFPRPASSCPCATL